MANRARRSVGGGVLINFIKLAAVLLAPTVPQGKSLVSSLKSQAFAFVNAFVYIEFREYLTKSCGFKRAIGRWDVGPGTYTIWNIAPLDAAKRLHPD